MREAFASFESQGVRSLIAGVHNNRGLALAEMGLDFVFDDPFREGVRQRPLQAIAHLQKHLSVTNENEQNRSIILRLLTHPPGLRHPNRVILDWGVRLHFWVDHYQNLG